MITDYHIQEYQLIAGNKLVQQSCRTGQIQKSAFLLKLDCAVKKKIGFEAKYV